MSGTDLVKELPGLTEAQRRRALELQSNIRALEAELQELLTRPESASTGIDLQARGIDKTHAAELRARLKTFLEDWDRPEAAIYAEAPERGCGSRRRVMNRANL